MTTTTQSLAGATLVLLCVVFSGVDCLEPTVAESVREYCLTEYFVARCSAPGDVILMTSALYGRMRVGRCIRGDFNIGCSRDVIALFDDQCSGRAACNVSVRRLVDEKPCQRDFASYLEASSPDAFDHVTSTCVTDSSSSNNNNNNNGGETGSGIALIDTSTSFGYLASSPQLGHADENPDHTRYEAALAGTRLCPWVVRARPGQRVQLTFIALGALHDVSAAAAHRGDWPPDRQASAAGALDACPKVVISELDEKESKSISAFPHASETASGGGGRDFDVCRMRMRETHLYTSAGSELAIYVTTTTASTQQKHQHPPPAAMTSSAVADVRRQISPPGPRFLLMYRLIGCPFLRLSARAWSTPVQGSDDVMVRCNDTMEVWYLSCRDNRWIGYYENCSGEPDEAGRNSMTYDAETTEIYLTQSGILLALSLGLVLGVAIAVTAVSIVCCSQRTPCIPCNRVNKMPTEQTQQQQQQQHYDLSTTYGRIRRKSSSQQQYNPAATTTPDADEQLTGVGGINHIGLLYDCPATSRRARSSSPPLGRHQHCSGGCPAHPFIVSSAATSTIWNDDDHHDHCRCRCRWHGTVVDADKCVSIQTSAAASHPPSTIWNDNSSAAGILDVVETGLLSTVDGHDAGTDGLVSNSNSSNAMHVCCGHPLPILPPPPPPPLTSQHLHHHHHHQLRQHQQGHVRRPPALTTNSHHLGRECCVLAIDDVVDDVDGLNNCSHRLRTTF